MKLLQHQLDVLNQTDGQNRVAYFLEMGLGKTFVGAEKAFQLNLNILLICQKSKISDWIEHFTLYYPTETVYNLTTKNGLQGFTDAFNGGRTVGAINYELAWRRPELLKLKNFTLMLDESSLIQNRKAKQSKFVLKLKPENVILLSGTPCGGKYENLWTQCHLLGWDISERLYNAQYVNFEQIYVGGGMTRQIVDRKNPYKNIGRLKQKMRDHGAVFLKTEECFDLPEQRVIEVNVSNSPAYKKFMKTGIVTVDGVELIGDTSLTKRLYARQLCGIYSEAKIQAFKDLLDSTNDRLIVFYNFNGEVDRLKTLTDKPVSIVNGHEKDLTAYETCEDSVTFIQYQAGAMGLNLQKANKIIYYSLPERSELFEQSKKRIHRIGQNRPCFYYVMMCRGTVENAIYDALKQRRDYTDELFKRSDNYG